MSKAGLYPWMKEIHKSLPDHVDYEKDGCFFEIIDETQTPPFALSIMEVGENDFIVTGFRGEKEEEFEASCFLDRVVEIVKENFPSKGE